MASMPERFVASRQLFPPAVPLRKYATPLTVGSAVEYMSSTNGGWMLAKVAKINQDGTYDLDVRAAASPEKIQVRTAVKHKRVLLYGDSLTAGYHSKGSAFTPYGSELVAALAPEFDVEVYSCGCSGRSAATLVKERDSNSIVDIAHRHGQGLSRILEEKGPFDLVVIMAGTNDLAQTLAPVLGFGTMVEAHSLKNAAYLNGMRGKVSGFQGERFMVDFGPSLGEKALRSTNLLVEDFQVSGEIRRLHDICHVKGVSTVALTVPPNGCTLPGGKTAEYRQRWRQVNAQLEQWAAGCDHPPALLVNTEKLVPFPHAAHPYWDTDHLHFSPAGSTALGRDLAPLLAPLLRGAEATPRATAAPCEDIATTSSQKMQLQEVLVEVVPVTGKRPGVRQNTDLVGACKAMRPVVPFQAHGQSIASAHHGGA